MSENAHPIIGGNDTAKWGNDQKWAVVWFVSVIVLAPVFVAFLSKIDSWMYHNNDRVEISGVKLFDDVKTRSNRFASTHISSERSDPRANGSLVDAYKDLNQSK